MTNNNNNNIIFLSHTWEKDEEQRDTHYRVLQVKNALENQQFKTWFDEEKMIHDIDGSMSKGINDCTAIIIFITKKYSNKVNRAANDPTCIDNCHKECIYAYNSQKPCIPVIFEKCMKNTKKWDPGLIKFYFGNRLYIDGSSNDYENIATDIIKLISRTSERSLKVEVESPILKKLKVPNKSPFKSSFRSPLKSPFMSPSQTIKQICTSPLNLFKNNKVLPYPQRSAPIFKQLQHKESQTENIRVQNTCFLKIFC